MSAKPERSPAATPLRAAAYVRVSTEEQAQHGYGLQSQLREVQALVAKQQYVLTDTFTDDGHSGAELERPDLDRLRAAVRAKALDVICIHDADRLSRKLAHQLLLEDEFRRAGVRIEYVTFTPPDSPEGRLLGYVKGAVAEYEREKIRERTSRGRREKARAGRHAGGATPFGYRVDATSPGGLRVDPAEAETVRRMFAWLLDGTSVRGIAARLRQQGSRTRRGNAWSKSSVAKVLANEAYAGVAYYNRKITRDGVRVGERDRAEWIPTSVPAIVARGIWTRAQDQLHRHRGLLVGRPGARLFLLRGLLVCGSCGHRLHGAYRRKQRRHPTYRCASRDRLVDGERCRAPVRSALVLEDEVWRAITAGLRDPQRLLGTVTSKKLALHATRIDHQAEAADLRQRLTRVERHRARLVDLYTSEAVDKATFTTKDAPLRHEAETLTTQLATAEAQLTQGTADVQRHDAALRYARLARAGLDRADDAAKQRLLRLLVDRVVVHATRLDIHGILPTTSPDLVQDSNRPASPVFVGPPPDPATWPRLSRRGPTARERRRR
jgi:site-specific DNA recombinase